MFQAVAGDCQDYGSRYSTQHGDPSHACLPQGQGIPELTQVVLLVAVPVVELPRLGSLTATRLSVPLSSLINAKVHTLYNQSYFKIYQLGDNMPQCPVLPGRA